eukprot:jgi/Ulvmu1/384/UM001_0391.1
MGKSIRSNFKKAIRAQRREQVKNEKVVVEAQQRREEAMAKCVAAGASDLPVPRPVPPSMDIDGEEGARTKTKKKRHHKFLLPEPKQMDDGDEVMEDASMEAKSAMSKRKAQRKARLRAVASSSKKPSGVPKPREAEDRRVAIINAKKKAIKAFEPKSGPAWNGLLNLLILDTRDARSALQEHAFQALQEIALITPGFPIQIYIHASSVVVTGDGSERAHAAEVMCRAAERWPSWPVSQRLGHAVATVDDALLALSVGMQDMCAMVRQRIARLLPNLRLASEKYIALVLDKRRTLVLARRTAPAHVRSLPEASASIIDNASGALTQLLEDEYDFVRCEALRAVAALTLRSADLAALTWELLATVLYDDSPAVRVAAIAAMRVVHGAFREVPTAMCRSVRDALDDSDSSVRLAAVRLAAEIYFPEPPLLSPVLHRLISLCSPSQWLPLPMDACAAAAAAEAAAAPACSTTSATPAQGGVVLRAHGAGHGDNVVYDACSQCIMQTLRALRMLGIRHSAMLPMMLPLALESRQGFRCPDVPALMAVLRESQHGAAGEVRSAVGRSASPAGGKAVATGAAAAGGVKRARESLGEEQGQETCAPGAATAGNGTGAGRAAALNLTNGEAVVEAVDRGCSQEPAVVDMLKMALAHVRCGASTAPAGAPVPAQPACAPPLSHSAALTAHMWPGAPRATLAPVLPPPHAAPQLRPHLPRSPSARPPPPAHPPSAPRPAPPTHPPLRSRPPLRAPIHILPGTAAPPAAGPAARPRPPAHAPPPRHMQPRPPPRPPATLHPQTVPQLAMQATHPMCPRPHPPVHAHLPCGPRPPPPGARPAQPTPPTHPPRPPAPPSPQRPFPQHTCLLRPQQARPAQHRRCRCRALGPVPRTTHERRAAVRPCPGPRQQQLQRRLLQTAES